MTAAPLSCESTFRIAERNHPDLMEPYSSRLAEAADAAEREEIMRSGLRETFRFRYPMESEKWPPKKSAASAQP